MTSLMLDIETLGVNSRAPVLQIAAILFNPLTGDCIEESAFNYHLTLEDQFNNGRIADASTIAWWMQQSDEARAAVFGTKEFPAIRMDTSFALGQLANHFKWEGLDVWAKGVTFDIGMVGSLYEEDTLVQWTAPPWQFWRVRCMRTLSALGCDEAMNSVEKPAGFIAHDALSDCRLQAKQVYAALKFLGRA